MLDENGFKEWLRERIHELSWSNTTMVNMMRSMRSDLDELLQDKYERKGEQRLMKKIFLIYIPGVAALVGIIAFLISR